MTDENIDELCAQVHTDLAGRLSSFGDGYMIVKYLAMVETIDQAGERVVISLTSDDMKAWDTLGLLTYGAQVQQAAVTRSEDER